MGGMEPMLVYYKNSFMLRHVIGDRPIRMLRDLVEEYLSDEWLDPALYSFGHVEAAIYAHCR